MIRYASFLAALLVAALALPVPARADFSSYARVLDDGSLSVNGRWVRIQGIMIPPSDRLCGANDMPTTCAPRAVLQLIRKIGAEFVRCRELGVDDQGAILGRCAVQGDDLGGWMVLNGWAMANPDAPLEYRQWERLAESRRIGIWGGPFVDNVIVTPPPRRVRPDPPPTQPQPSKTR
jgi:endonuclease YncB( thermonuclease family)